MGYNRKALSWKSSCHNWSLEAHLIEIWVIITGKKGVTAVCSKHILL